MCIGLNNKRPKVQNPASLIVWGCVWHVTGKMDVCDSTFNDETGYNAI